MEQLSFRSSDIEASNAFDAYHDLYSYGSSVERLGERFMASVAGLRFPRMVLFKRELAGVSHERGVKRVVADDFDHLNMQFVVAGSMLMATGDRTQVVEAGQIAIFDMTRPQRTWTRGVEMIAASIAREVLPRNVRTSHAMHGLILPAERASLLGDVLRSLVLHGPPDDTGLAEASTVAVGSLLGASLLSVADLGGAASVIETAKLDRAMAFIQREIGRPDLSAESVARAVGVSRSVLYRSFEPLGGIARFVLRQRLSALRGSLARSGEGRPFNALAEAHGFASASHANRSFRQAFGMTPGEFRNAQREGLRAGEAPGDAKAQMQRLLAELK